MARLKVLQAGIYPGSAKVITRRLRGEDVPDEECRWVELTPGQVLDGGKLDPRIVKSLLANGIVEEVAE